MSIISVICSFLRISKSCYEHNRTLTVLGKWGALHTFSFYKFDANVFLNVFVSSISLVYNKPRQPCLIQNKLKTYSWKELFTQTKRYIISNLYRFYRNEWQSFWNHLKKWTAESINELIYWLINPSFLYFLLFAA